MNIEAQRIAISEVCGWKRHEMFIDEVVKWKKGDDTLTLLELPDYLNDLNAMNEAEKTLTNQQRGIFEVWLTDILKVISVPHASLSEGALFKLVHATAAYRAEAFLKTMNLWKD